MPGGGEVDRQGAAPPGGAQEAAVGQPPPDRRHAGGGRKAPQEAPQGRGALLATGRAAPRRPSRSLATPLPPSRAAGPGPPRRARRPARACAATAAPQRGRAALAWRPSAPPARTPGGPPSASLGPAAAARRGGRRRGHRRPRPGRRTGPRRSDPSAAGRPSIAPRRRSPVEEPGGRKVHPLTAAHPRETERFGRASRLGLAGEHGRQPGVVLDQALAQARRVGRTVAPVQLLLPSSWPRREEAKAAVNRPVLARALPRL